MLKNLDALVLGPQASSPAGHPPRTSNVTGRRGRLRSQQQGA